MNYSPLKMVSSVAVPWTEHSPNFETSPSLGEEKGLLSSLPETGKIHPSFIYRKGSTVIFCWIISHNHKVPGWKGTSMIICCNPFLAKARSRQDGPAPCPAESYKCLTLGNPPLPWWDCSKAWLFSLWQLSLLCLNWISPGVTCTHYPSFFLCDPL